jgi:hypothetical protein
MDHTARERIKLKHGEREEKFNLAKRMGFEHRGPRLKCKRKKRLN